MLRAVVFDFDLTLVDSAAPIAECARHALQCLGLPPATPEQVRKTIGLTLQQSFVMLTGNPDPALADGYARHYVSRADEVMVAGTRMYPGVPAMLQRLRARGMRLGIVSSKFRRRIQPILEREGLGRTIDLVLGAEDVTAHKPHPEGLLAALATLEVPIPHGLYVGDHLVDAQAAGRAGVAFVAVRTGGSPPESWGVSPLGVIDDASGLVELLERTGHLSAA